MQDAIVGSWTHAGRWAQDSYWSPAVLGSLHDLNHRFLELAASRREGWPAGGALMGFAATGAAGTVAAGQLAHLSEAQRGAAAACPYALFDLRFQDDGYWQPRLHDAPPCRVADESVIDDDTVNFVRLALFYAWHVASGAGLAAQLLLGMSGNTAAAFRRVSVNHLPALVASEAVNLSARWSECDTFWNALAAAAARANPAALRRVQLYGLQLAAAARLSRA